MVYNFDVLAIASVATVVGTQILKSKYVPVAFQDKPRLTTCAVAVIASVVAAIQTGYDISATTQSISEFVGFVIATAVISAITYNNLVK